MHFAFFQVSPPVTTVYLYTGESNAVFLSISQERSPIDDHAELLLGLRFIDLLNLFLQQHQFSLFDYYY